jgi:hypothetical protein
MKTLFISLVTVVVLGCSNNSGGSDASTDSPSDQSSAASCTSDPDCPNAGDHCYYKIGGGCSIAGSSGTCITFAPSAGCTPNVACGCDDTTISVCAPDGYVTFPNAMSGACPASDASTDAPSESSTDDGAVTDATSE